MPVNTRPHLHLRVFIASPGDTKPEREAARWLMETRLPRDALLPCIVTFEVVAYDHPEARTQMLAHLSPQDAVVYDKGLPSACDVVVVILRERMGTPLDPAKTKRDGTPFLSGTEWEYEEARNAAKPPEIVVYRCVNAGNVTPELAAFVTGIKNRTGPGTGSVNDFTDTADFRDGLERFLKSFIVKRFEALPGKPIVLPYPSLGTLFKGRDTFLRNLMASLTRDGGGRAAIAGRAVHGLGGVGKTRAAVEYAWAHRDDYTALALLEAETPERLQSSLAALTGPLRLPEAAAQEDAVKIEAAVAWLNANPGWFLILDNLDTEAAVAAANWLLGRLTGGHVVLTSRLSAGFARGVEKLDLDVLDLDAAAAFLLEAAGKPPEQVAEARALAADLGQLALALEMAAATIDARGLSFAAYRKLWEGNRARVVGWASQKITGYHHAVAETWQTSVDQLSADGRALLERLAFLAPEPVPYSLLAVPVPGVEGEDPEAALDDLAAYSLVRRGAEDGPFLVHRLVQDVTRRGLEKEARGKARLVEALEWVDAAFEGNPQDVRSWPVLDPLAEHAVAVAEYAEAAAIGEPTARLMGALDMLFDAKAQYVRAERMSRAALRLVEASRGKDHPDLAIRPVLWRKHQRGHLPRDSGVPIFDSCR